jgi:photosystem II stability/assembly factor-like uncharacterized protein
MVELAAALALLIGPAPLFGPSVAWGDSQHAWVGGGDRGAIYGTADGGATWRKQTGGPALELAATDARHAWALSAQGVTISTTDGTHWHIIGVQKLERLSFVDAHNGFALEANGFVLRTHDGGVSWKGTASPYGLQSICFSSARTGWAARGGTVWTTHDSGAHWQSRLLLRSRQGYPIPELGCRGSAVWAVFHSSAAAGSEGYAVFRSLNAGKTWRAVYGQFLRRGLPRIDAYAGPLAVLPSGGAVLEGSCSPCGRGRVTLVAGGRRTRFAGWLPGPLAFADGRHGLAVLTQARTGVPSVWRTVNGRTWSRVFSSKLLRP